MQTIGYSLEPSIAGRLGSANRFVLIRPSRPAIEGSQPCASLTSLNGASKLRERANLRHHRCMDKLDRRILDLLQKNGALTAAEVAEKVGLSKVPCWRRIKRLEETGVIRQTVAILDAKALNVGTTVFVMMRTANHSAAWFDKFVKAVRDIPEVTEIYRMSGEVDYLMRIVVPDIDGYDVVYKKLIAAIDFLDVSASFALETIKSTTALPLHYLKAE